MNKNMRRQRVIYGLHSGAFSFAYIGSTNVNAKTRWWEHRSRARGGHMAPIYDWMRAAGIDSVQIHVIAHVPTDVEMSEVEAGYIDYYKRHGHDLKNELSADGIPNSNGERMKRKLSEQRSGKPTWIKGKTGEAAGWTEERRRKQSETIRARNLAKAARLVP